MITMLNRRLVEDFFSRKIEFRGVERELKIEETEKITSIVGPRRAGKTWFLFYLISGVENGMYVNFEDIAFRKLETEEFFEVLKIFSEMKQKPEKIFFDEVQALEGWEILVRSLYDRGYRLCITGSSSKLLAREIATQLRGRTLTYILLPFSFREFLRAKKVEPDVRIFEERGALLRHLREFLWYGGFPEVVLSRGRERILSQYFDEIFYKDFVERHRIKSLEFGRFLFEFAFQNFSKEVSLRKIKNFFGRNVSDRTLYEYSEKIQDTMAVFFLERYSKSIYRRKSWPRKIYICDLGVSSILGSGEDTGKRMENAVFLELLRKTNENPRLRFYYWRDLRGREVDFVVMEGARIKQLLQVTYASARDEVEGRELKALFKAGRELNCSNLLVLTWDYEGEEDGIKFVPLWKWLCYSAT